MPQAIVGSYYYSDMFGIGALQDWSKMSHIVAGYGCYVTSASNPTLVYTLNNAEKTKAQNAGCKYLLSFGGGSNLTAIMHNSTYRSQLVTNLVNLIGTGGFDGLQIDWEDFDSGVNNADYHAFLVALRSAIPAKYIMPCVPADITYEWIKPADEPYYDALFIMGYGGPGASRWGTLYSKFTDYMEDWIASFTPSKILAGIPLYTSDAGDMFGAYYQVIAQLSPATSVNTITRSTANGWNQEANPYSVVNGKTVVDGTLYLCGKDLAAQKAQWAVDNAIGGIGLWAFNWDYTPGSDYSILDAVYDLLNAEPEPPDPPPEENSAPVLTYIRGKSVQAGTKLTFIISATDVDADPLTYSAADLPAGASFRTSTRRFSWIPNTRQTGTHYVTFTVSDGELTDSERVMIRVYRKARR
jgi:hypothetical protein